MSGHEREMVLAFMRWVNEQGHWSSEKRRWLEEGYRAGFAEAMRMAAEGDTVSQEEHARTLESGTTSH